MERNDASLLQGGTAPTNLQAACHRDLPPRSRSHLREHPREVSSHGRSAQVPFERDFPARRSGADGIDVGHKHTHVLWTSRSARAHQKGRRKRRKDGGKRSVAGGGRKGGNEATRRKTDADPNDHGIRTRAEKSAASGVAVDQECVKMFMNLKTRRTYRYIIFKIDEQTGMVKVEKEAGPKATFEEFQENLPEAECRYAVIDYPFTDKEGCQKTKIFFVSWSPEISKVKSKMLYASSKEKFRRELDGVHLELQATDDSEIDTQAFLDKCM